MKRAVVWPGQRMLSDTWFTWQLCNLCQRLVTIKVLTHVTDYMNNLGNWLCQFCGKLSTSKSAIKSVSLFWVNILCIFSQSKMCFHFLILSIVYVHGSKTKHDLLLLEEWSRWSYRRSEHPSHSTWSPPSLPEWSPTTKGQKTEQKSEQQMIILFLRQN